MLQKWIVSCLMVIFLFNCKRKEDTAWDVDVLSPVIKTSLTIDDLVADSILSINADNTVDLDYKFNIQPLDDNFFFEIPDTSITSKYGFPFLSPVTLAPGFQFVNDPVESELDLGDAKIEYMEIHSGELSYRFVSEVNERTFYTYRILKSDDGNGNEFQRTISVPAGTRSNPSVVTGTFKFNGYSFDLTGNSGTRYNTMASEITVNVDPNGSPVQVSNLDTVYAHNKLISLKPAYLRGYLGQQNFHEGPNTNNFSVFEQICGGTLDIDSVNIYTEIKNYVGAEAQVKLKQFISSNSTTGTNVSLAHNTVGNWINLNRATDDAYGHNPSIKQIEYTKANSNIDLVIENLSDKITTEFDASLNPLGNVSSGNDFLYFDKVIDADFHINLPLKFIAKNLKFRQEIDLNFTEETNPVHNALLSIYAKNGFPFDAEMQIYLLNTSNVIIDSIKVDGLMRSAMTDINNDVTAPTNSILKYAIPSNKMEILNKNSKVILQLIFNTNNAPHTTIYSHYKADLKLVTDMNMEISYR